MCRDHIFLQLLKACRWEMSRCCAYKVQYWYMYPQLLYGSSHSEEGCEQLGLVGSKCGAVIKMDPEATYTRFDVNRLYLQESMQLSCVERTWGPTGEIRARVVMRIGYHTVNIQSPDISRCRQRGKMIMALQVGGILAGGYACYVQPTNCGNNPYCTCIFQIVAACTTLRFQAHNLSKVHTR